MNDVRKNPKDKTLKFHSNTFTIKKLTRSPKAFGTSYISTIFCFENGNFMPNVKTDGQKICFGKKIGKVIIDLSDKTLTSSSLKHSTPVYYIVVYALKRA